MMKQAGAASGIILTFQVMPYARAIEEAKGGRAHLLMHTPHGLESPEYFYATSKDLAWAVPTRMDVFYTDPAQLAAFETVVGQEGQAPKVGIPHGNEAFGAAMLGAGTKNLHTAALDQVVKTPDASPSCGSNAPRS